MKAHPGIWAMRVTQVTDRESFHTEIEGTLEAVTGPASGAYDEKIEDFPLPRSGGEYYLVPEWLFKKTLEELGRGYL